MKFLPSEIGRLTQLRVLSLGKNQLTSLPSEIGRLAQLRLLFLDDNQLTSLPSEIRNLTQLEVLTLYGNLSLQIPYWLNIGRLKYFNIGDVELGKEESVSQDYRDMLDDALAVANGFAQIGLDPSFILYSLCSIGLRKELATEGQKYQWDALNTER